ncbi:mCG140981, isoform CRA_b [Mus musculus]|nr:mCG140981, isoform CRA_b [Mus musculus]
MGRPNQELNNHSSLNSAPLQRICWSLYNHPVGSRLPTYRAPPTV